MIIADVPQPAGASFDTAPAPLTGLRRLRMAAVKSASRALLPVMQRVGRSYVGGATTEDALAVAQRLAAEGSATTVGFWDTPDNTPRQLADEYLATIAQLPTSALDCYVSIKPPALRFEHALAEELAVAGSVHQVHLHLDSHGPEVADASNALLDVMARHVSPEFLSTTLPGRWARSLSDAAWATERGFAARVVKGQWPDPTDPDRDMRAGYLEVIDRLAGCARHVAVASQDVPLVAEAVARLRAAGTPCELELLFGLPIKPALTWARAHGVRTRVYVPYGPGYLPYAAAQLRRNPRFAWWIVKDLAHPGASR